MGVWLDWRLAQDVGHCITEVDLPGDDSGVTNGSDWTAGADRSGIGLRGKNGGRETRAWCGNGGGICELDLGGNGGKDTVGKDGAAKGIEAVVGVRVTSPLAIESGGDGFGASVFLELANSSSLLDIKQLTAEASLDGP